VSVRRFGSRIDALREHLGVVLVLSALIALTVFGFEPARALAINWDQLSIDFGELARRLTLPLGAAFVALSLAGFVIVGVAGVRGVALITALYVGLWLQTSVLVWEYGPFDGRSIAWEKFGRQRGLELVAWVGVIGCALWKAPLVRRRVWSIVAVVFVLYVVSFTEQIARAAPFPDRKQAAAPSSGLSSYSSERNALVIVLDTFQSDFFAELLLEPEFAASLPPGLTYYRNATSYYGSTQFSLQSILTAARVPDGVYAPGFIDDEMARSVPSRLGELGFDAVLATFATGNMPGCDPTQGPYTCVRLEALRAPSAATAQENLWRADVSEVLRVGWFRSSPQVIKQRIRGRRGWRLSPPFELLESRSRVDPRIDEMTRTDLLVIEKLTRELEVDEVSPRFRFLHFHTPHHPVSIDGNCDYVDTTRIHDLERWQTLGAARCILSRVFDYLRALDAAGGYDPSAVFIVADHGSHFPVDRSVANPPLPPATGSDPGFDFSSRGLPLFLVKPVSERGALQISDRPVALCDLPNSVYAVFDVRDRVGCRSVFDPQPRRTPRHYYRYPDYFEQQRRRITNFEFDDYIVDGHAWHVESWRRAAAAPGR